MSGAKARERLPALPPEQLTDEQRRAAQAIIDGPRGGLVGPFVPLLRSPELMDAASRMGEYLRYRSAIGTTLSELVILLVSRQWSQQVEWAIHAPVARRAGIADATIAAVAEGRRPEALSADEALVYDFCTELAAQRSVSDATWAKAVARFGEKGVVDLMGLNGYYAFLALVMNGARTAAPASEAPPLPPLPG